MAAKKESGLKSLNVRAPGFFKAVNEQLDTQDINALKSYMRWHTVHRFAPGLSEPFVQENFNFFTATLAGQKEQTPRWKRCTASPTARSARQSDRTGSPGTSLPRPRTTWRNLLTALEKAMDEDIKQLDWMSDTTKVEAKKKLDAFRDKIGYPDKWRDYSSLTIKRDDPVGNVSAWQSSTITATSRRSASRSTRRSGA